MTYTVAELEVSPIVFRYIKGLMEKGGYQHAIEDRSVDMTHVAIVPGMPTLKVMDRECDDLTDCILFFTEKGFRDGYEKGVEDGEHRDNVCKAWDGYDISEEVKGAAMEVVTHYSDTVRAEMTAENEPSMSIIRQAAILMKPKLDASEVHAFELADRITDITRAMKERGFTFDMEAAERFVASLEEPDMTARVAHIHERDDMYRKEGIYRVSWIESDGSIGTSTCSKGFDAAMESYEKMRLDPNVTTGMLVRWWAGEKTIVNNF